MTHNVNVVQEKWHQMLAKLNYLSAAFSILGYCRNMAAQHGDLH